MSRYPRLKGLATLASALLAACSAGGSTDKGSAPPTAQPSRAENVAVSFSVHVPTSSAKSKARRTSTIPAVTQSIQIVVLDSANNPAVGSPFTLDTSASSPACVGSGASRTCITQIGIPVGNDTITATAYDGPNGTGNLVASATVAQQIYLNATNIVGITLLTSTLAATITPGLYASATGNAITMLNSGALATLTVSGGTGAYTVTPTCLPSIVTLTASSNSIYQIGPGGYLGSCPITISDGIATLASLSVTVVAFPSYLPFGPLNFYSLGSNAQQSVTINGGVLPYTITSSTPNLTASIVGNTLSVYPNPSPSPTPNPSPSASPNPTPTPNPYGPGSISVQDLLGGGFTILTNVSQGG